MAKKKKQAKGKALPALRAPRAAQPNKKRRRRASPAAPCFASIYPGIPKNALLASKNALPLKFASAVRQLEKVVKLPIWLLVQDKRDPAMAQDSYNMLGDVVSSAFFEARHVALARGQKIALLIDSNGGRARQTYELAMLLRRHCGGFTAIIPRHAKSAATLLTLGADEIIMNTHAELGPLDVQMFDADREEWLSGLDEVQSLERLEAFAMDALDRTIVMLWKRTRKSFKTLIPFATDFVTKLTQPMFSGVDVVRYTQMSRALRVAEEYGKRLLRRNYGGDAEEIAKRLVENYPEHGFPVYPDEAAELGLKLAPQSPQMQKALERITRHLPNLNVVGRIT